MIKTLRRLPFGLKLAGSLIVCAVLFVVSLVLGARGTTLLDVWLAVASDAVNNEILAIRELRLPRETGAAVVGAALGVAGAVMQGVTRNPLADPGLIGLSAGANAGLAVAIAFIPGLNYIGIMAACFMGAAAGASLVIILSSARKGSLSPLRIVLAGAAVSAFLTAVTEGIGILFNISKEVNMWTAGGLMGTTWKQLLYITPVIAAGILVAVLLSKQLTILSLSEEVAVGLGQKLVQIKAVLFVVVILLTGAAVALVGNMAFIGLMIPHIVRSFAGTDYRYILPLSAVSGAAFMLLADTLGRTINAPYETPVAAIVAIIGLPFFLLVVHKGGKTIS